MASLGLNSVRLGCGVHCSNGRTRWRGTSGLARPSRTRRTIAERCGGASVPPRAPARFLGVVTANVIRWRDDVEAWVLARDASVAVVCVQEHRLIVAKAAMASKRLAWAGWRSHWDAGDGVDGTLPGIAILWRQHLCVTPVALPRVLRGRACAAALRVKGVDLGILSIYLRSGQ